MCVCVWLIPNFGISQKLSTAEVSPAVLMYSDHKAKFHIMLMTACFTNQKYIIPQQPMGEFSNTNWPSPYLFSVWRQSVRLCASVCPQMVMMSLCCVSDDRGVREKPPCERNRVDRLKHFKLLHLPQFTVLSPNLHLFVYLCQL